MTIAMSTTDIEIQGCCDPARWLTFAWAVLFLTWSNLVGQTPLSRLVPPAGLPASSAPTNSSAAANQSDPTAGDLEARLAEARDQLAVAAGLTNAPAGISAQDLWARRAVLHRLVQLYELQLSSVGTLEKARARKAEIGREAQAWTRFAEPPPYSILLTDRLREEIQAERQKITNGEASGSILNQLIAENRRALSQAEGKIRRLNEQLESSNAPEVTARLSWQRELERLRSQLAVATIGVLDSERAVGQENVAESRIRLDLLQRQLILAEPGVKFTQADLDQVTSQLKEQLDQLQRELAETQPRRLAAVRALETAREELRVIQGRPEDSSAAARAVEQVAVRETQFDTAETATYVLRLLLEGANVEHTMWEMRFAAYESRSAEALTESEHHLDVFIRRLNLWKDYARQQLDGCSSQLQLQETRLNTMASDSDLLPLARERLASLRDREALLLRFVRAVERMTRLSERWAEAVRAAEENLPFASRVLNLFSDARLFLQRLWTFEIFTAEDTITVEGQKITGKRGVTIGKVVMALLILVVGYWITGLLTAFIEPVIAKRLRIEPNQANLIRRWLRALLLVCLLLFSLVSVKIPLTVFAFAGGALAIGLGFGMQTILKNLVSGLILLFERPFRVGDVLDVGGQRGTVTGIGLRASVLQSWDGTETLIPNSSLLENNVTNWTYSNPKVRFSVSVGVAYGSDSRQVIKLLNEVVERHGLVEKDPKPQVLFTDFGDSALVFELRFWLDVVRANSALVSSDLRVMIAGAFNEYGIVVAFPQRDLHLLADRPIPLQVIPPAAGQAQALPIPGSADPPGQTR